MHSRLQSLEMSSPTDMTATVVIKVGPVKATFGGKVTSAIWIHPTDTGSAGKDQAVSRALPRAVRSLVGLEQVGERETVLHYEVNSQIGGKLAQLGARLIDSTAKKLAGEFFTRFGAVISSETRSV